MKKKNPVRMYEEFFLFRTQTFIKYKKRLVLRPKLRVKVRVRRKAREKEREKERKKR